MDRISPDLEKNRQWVEETFQNCDDILHRQETVKARKARSGRQHFLQETGFFLYREIPVCIKYPVKDIRASGYPRQKVKRSCGVRGKDLQRARKSMWH